MSRFVFYLIIVGLFYRCELIFGYSTNKGAAIQINPPVLVSPSNGAQRVSIVVPLLWNPVDSASSYDINIAFDSLFTRMAYEENAVLSTSRNVAGLSWGTKYYWRIAANVNGVTGPWSQVRSFAIIVRTPLLLYPVNYAVNIPVNVRLKWEIIHNADYYTLEISASPGFSGYFYYGNVTDTVKQLDSLAANTTYYWRLRAKNENGFSEYTDIFNFTTARPLPPSPALVSPKNGAQYQPVNLSLIWNSVSGAQSYRIQVSRDSAFNTTIYDNQDVKATTLQIYSLDYGTKYYWRVNAQTASGTTAFSRTSYFITVLQPPENLTATALDIGRIKLTWLDRSFNELGFIIERKTSAELDFSVIDKASANSITFTDLNVSGGNTYMYRVKSFTKDASSTYSNEVILASVTSAGNALTAPKDYYLYQNHPNPFNPSTIIKYALPFTSRVTLFVYNALGKLVKELDGLSESPGYHEISFDASALPSGVYFYSLLAQSIDGTRQFGSVRKMIFIK